MNIEMPISYKDTLDFIKEQVRQELENLYPDDADAMISSMTDVYTRQYQSTPKLTEMLTSNWTPNNGILSNLFDVDNATTASINELKIMYPDMDICILLPMVIAGSLQDKLLSDVENLQIQKKTRQNNTQEQIDKMNIMQKKKVEMALQMETQGYRSARAGIRPSGKDTTEADLQEPPRKRKWWEYLIVAIVVAAVTVITMGTTFTGALTTIAILFAAWSIVNSIAQSCINSIGDPYDRADAQAAYAQYDLCSVLTDMVVDICILIMDLDQNDQADRAKIEDIRQKTQMGLNIAMSVIGMVFMIAIGIVISIATAGAGTAALVAAIIASVIMAGLDITASAFSILAGQTAIEFAHKKLDEAERKLRFTELNNAIDLLKNQMEMIDQRIDFLTELFSSSAESVQKEIQRASDILKDIGDAKATIARNIGA